MSEVSRRQAIAMAGTEGIVSLSPQQKRCLAPRHSHDAADRRRVMASLIGGTPSPETRHTMDCQLAQTGR